MKYNCDLIQDLLPLYEEGLCSPSSRAAVEEHLTECPDCRKLSGNLPEIEPPVEAPQADRAVKKSIKKVRRKWLTSLVAAMLIVPVLLLSLNQFTGRGICFTNIDDYFAARKLLSALEQQDWEAVAALHDYSGKYDSILDALAMAENEWGPSFSPVTIEGKEYMQSRLAEPYDLSTAADLFGYIYNRSGWIFLDAALWEQVCAVDPEAVERSENRYTINHETYERFSTPWGEFVGNEDLDGSSPYDVCTGACLVPLAIWQEASEALADDARTVYSATHEAYGHVADMTEAEFLTFIEEKYTADLSVLEEMGFEIRHTGFHHTYRQDADGSWWMVFDVQVTCQGQTLDADITIISDQGKVGFNGLSHPAEERYTWMMDLSDILYPSAHPDY